MGRILEFDTSHDDPFNFCIFHVENTSFSQKKIPSVLTLDVPDTLISTVYYRCDITCFVYVIEGTSKTLLSVLCLTVAEHTRKISTTVDTRTNFLT